MRSNLLNFQTLERRIIVLRIKAVCPSFLLPGYGKHKNINKRGVNSYFFSSRALTNVRGYLEETSNLFAWSPPGEWFPECRGECQAKIWLHLSQLLMCAHISYRHSEHIIENIPGRKVWLPRDLALIFNWYFKAQHINSFEKTFRTFVEITQWNLMSVMQWIV